MRLGAIRSVRGSMLFRVGVGVGIVDADAWLGSVLAMKMMWWKGGIRGTHRREAGMA
jgi:hypothetical protein